MLLGCGPIGSTLSKLKLKRNKYLSTIGDEESGRVKKERKDIRTVEKKRTEGKIIGREEHEKNEIIGRGEVREEKRKIRR